MTLATAKTCKTRISLHERGAREERCYHSPSYESPEPSCTKCQPFSALISRPWQWHWKHTGRSDTENARFLAKRVKRLYSSVYLNARLPRVFPELGRYSCTRRVEFFVYLRQRKKEKVFTRLSPCHRTHDQHYRITVPSLSSYKGHLDPLPGLSPARAFSATQVALTFPAWQKFYYSTDRFYRYGPNYHTLSVSEGPTDSKPPRRLIRSRGLGNLNTNSAKARPRGRELPRIIGPQASTHTRTRITIKVSRATSGKGRALVASAT